MLVPITKTRNAITLSIKTGATVLLIGERGIGKSSIVRQIADNMKAALFTIDGSLLKEGELGGLPTVVGKNSSNNVANKIGKIINYVNSKNESVFSNKDNLNKILFKLKNDVMNDDIGNEVETKYATFHTLADIQKLYEKDPNKKIILFFDELNRCENATMQELMNLLLNRTINGYVLPETVSIIAAANPSSKFSDFQDSEYHTNDLDAAQLDRLRVFFVNMDTMEWIKWGMTVIDEENNICNIHPDIISFIASNEDQLNNPSSTDDIQPSPRSYERLSKSYYEYVNNKSDYKLDDFKLIAMGDIGVTAANMFIEFIKNKSNPLVTPDEVFRGGDKLDEEIKKRIEEDTYLRKATIVESLFNYMIREKTITKNKINVLWEVMQLLTKDQFYSSVFTLSREQKYLKIHNGLCKIEEYLDLFLNLHNIAEQ